MPTCTEQTLPILAMVAVLAVTRSPAAEAEPAATPPAEQYPREEIHDRYVGPDEAVTDLRIANSRWPDCYSNGSAIADIFRLEGVADKPDPDKAMALWKWHRILFCPKYGGYYHEEQNGGAEPRAVYDTHTLFTVYGHHYCDGTAWVMNGLWRAAGYIALDQSHHSHTIPSLRYRDADGVWRFHDFEPEDDAYYWDESRGIVGTWTMPLLYGRVHRHLLHSQQVHTLRRSLRLGESVALNWDNDGYFVPHGRHGPTLKVPKGYEHQPGRQDGVYAAIGQETQTLAAETAPDRYAAALFDGSTNTACSAPADGKATLHPARAGATASFVYRLPSPFVAVDAEVRATLVKAADADICRLSLSTDRGQTWAPVFTKEKTGAETVTVNVGRLAREEGRPSVYSRYEFLLRAEFSAAGDPRGTGMNALLATVRRQCNKRTLPNLRPGKNAFRVTGTMQADRELALTVRYAVNGAERARTLHITQLPFFFELDTGQVEDPPRDNYDQAFNVGALRMRAIELAAAPLSGDPDRSQPPEWADEYFRAPSPHPAVLASKRLPVKTPETDPMQTSGFFPQSRVVRQDPAEVKRLLEVVRTGQDRAPWIAAEKLGDYPEALDALLEIWPTADIDLTMFLCKALAQIGSPKAIEPLLKRWKDKGAAGAPGTRYIPDVLAAIGDRRVVPDLIAPLRTMRFDYRFHIVHALGILGGPEAEAALKDVAANDPCPAVRQYGAERLKSLEKR